VAARHRQALACSASPPTPLDVPAELIAEIYRHRWTIELFFRFFKHFLGCRHLLSQAPVGIEIQTYCRVGRNGRVCSTVMSFRAGGEIPSRRDGHVEQLLSLSSQRISDAVMPPFIRPEMGNVRTDSQPDWGTLIAGADDRLTSINWRGLRC
jgi:hypothetical protein